MTKPGVKKEIKILKKKTYKMGKRKQIYQVKKTGQYVICCGCDIEVKQGEDIYTAKVYELLNQDFERTGITGEFSPEELEIFQQ
jgi:hypothetical protein